MARQQASLFWPLFLSALLLACSNAYAERVATPHTHLAPSAESPYQIELIGQNGLPLDTYQHRGRFYVLGDSGDRYSIRVTNPTAQRIEIVLSVDGLDVVDGKPADLRKRGYVIPPYGELNVDGFRVSTREVATFRFSSVSNSYAGRKGKARNVGVIGVAIFAERQAPAPTLVDPHPPVEHRHRRGRRVYDDFEDDGDEDVEIEIETTGSVSRADSAPRAKSPPAPRREAAKRPPRVAPESAPEADAPSSAPVVGSIRGGVAGSSSGGGRSTALDLHRDRGDRCCHRTRERPGLGTEFGERRHSAATWTRFVRANASRPTAMTELRYNDLTGLQALGIRIEVPDADEIYTRETADPFPGDFAQPPPY